MSPINEGAEITDVERLPNFPFRNFYEYRAANSAGVASPFVTGSTAWNWALAGTHSSNWMRIQAWGLAVIPVLTLIGFLLYAGIKQPLLLLASPLLAVAYFLFNPAMVRLLRIFAWGPLVLVLGAFIWAVAQGRPGFAVLTGALLAIWYSEKLRERRVVRGLCQAVAEHEDLLCSLWAAGVLGVAYTNGDVFWIDSKRQNGRDLHY